MEKKVLTHINGIEIYRRKIEVLPKNKDLQSQARSLRKGYILSEVLFWKQVRNNEFHLIDFDRQRIIGNYIVDFYVKSLGLVVEIEDSILMYDENIKIKDKYLESLDLKIIKFTKNRIMNDIGNVMLEIENYILENFS